MHFQGRTVSNVSIYMHLLAWFGNILSSKCVSVFVLKTDEHLPYLFIHDKENCHMNQCFNWFAGGKFCLLEALKAKQVLGDTRFAVGLMDRDRLTLANNVSCQILSGDCEILYIKPTRVKEWTLHILCKKNDPSQILNVKKDHSKISLPWKCWWNKWNKSLNIHGLFPKSTMTHV